MSTTGEAMQSSWALILQKQTLKQKKNWKKCPAVNSHSLFCHSPGGAKSHWCKKKKKFGWCTFVVSPQPHSHPCPVKNMQLCSKVTRAPHPALLTGHHTCIGLGGVVGHYMVETSTIFRDLTARPTPVRGPPRPGPPGMT